MANLVKWLSNWYQDQCNGSWEHEYGIRIDTLDNPGWQIEIDLINTSLENRSFENVSHDHSSTNWMFCKKEGCKFLGAGDPSKLETIIEQFHKWASSPSNKT